MLIFFSGARKLVLGSFVTLMLVERFGLKVWQVSTLMLVSSVLNLLVGPYLGTLIDRLGERMTTPISYAVLALCCLGYAVVPAVGTVQRSESVDSDRALGLDQAGAAVGHGSLDVCVSYCATRKS